MVVVRTLDGARELRPAWERLQWHSPEAQPDLFLATTEARGARPHVIVALAPDHSIDGMLLARVEPVPVLPALPVLSRLRPVLRTAVVVAGGVSGSDDTRRALIGKLMSCLRSAEFDAVWMRDVEPGSFEHECLRRAAPPTRRAPMVASPRWLIDLPDSYDAYRANLSRNLRRARSKEARALERRYGERLELERYPASLDAQRLLAGVEAVAACSYQREAGTGFVLEQHGPVVTTTLPLGTCRAWVLRLDGRPVAFELGWKFAGVYLGAFTAYDPEFRGAGVGGYVAQAVIADLIEDPDVHLYDHGPADYVYKRRLSTRATSLGHAWVFGPTLRGRLSWLARTAFECARWLKRRRGGAPAACAGAAVAPLPSSAP